MKQIIYKVLIVAFGLMFNVSNAKSGSLGLSGLNINAKIYYVSTTGNNTNTGTIDSPFKTINFAVAKLVAGDILYVRGGTYVETVSVKVSGTSSSPITISAYSGELPVIDGQNTLPVSNYAGLVNLSGNYVHISGIEVKNTISGNYAAGVVVNGHHNTVSNFKVHDIYCSGILIAGDYGIAEDSQVWQTNLSNVNGSGGGMWGNGIQAARDQVNGITLNAILRRNLVYNNWGEGVSTYEATKTIIEDNIVYDNWATNIYISDATYVLFQRNMVYVTDGNSFNQAAPGLMLADEVANKPRSANNTIINNFFVNGRVALFSWTGVSGSGLTNLLFANNTLSNAEIKTGTINSGNRIINNIFTGGANILSTSGVTWSNNCWQGIRPSNAVGTNDVLGDPLLALTGTVSPGQLTADNFKLSSASSPAINAGIVLTEVTEDYFKMARDTLPDIGGYEYQATVGISTVNSPSFRVFPNPSTNYLTVGLSNIQNNTQVQIFNTLGILTKELKLTSSKQEINIEDLASGVYFIRIKQLKDLSLKFIKQ